jgi:hypothetical protein
MYIQYYQVRISETKKEKKRTNDECVSKIISSSVEKMSSISLLSDESVGIKPENPLDVVVHKLCNTVHNYHLLCSLSDTVVSTGMIEIKGKVQQ